MLGNGRMRLIAMTGVLLVATGLATACAPDPAVPGAAMTSAASAPVVSGRPSATPTQTPAAATLPASCQGLYSSSMFAGLQQNDGPLNDPSMQLYSTQISQALEVLSSGLPTLRCTWGGPSGTGFSTNASVVDSGRAASVQDALDEAGFTCQPLSSGILCTVSSTTVDLRDNVVTHGETQYLDGALWITTAWVGALPDGYTQDIVTTLGR
jgi:hypothetical protein